LDAPGRKALERELIDSLSHLAVHSGVLDERLDDVLIDQAHPEELDEIIAELKAWRASP
jgi:hypothetical protein